MSAALETMGYFHEVPDREAPALQCPPRVTVFGPGSPATWQSEGRVIGRAPYSVQVRFQAPGERALTAWFIWEPGRPGHGKMHGAPADVAMRIEAVG